MGAGLPELVDTIRPSGLANQKPPRIQATLRRIREERGPKVSADDAHDLFLGMLDPEQMYEAHVILIQQHGRKLCHARRPECAVCPLRARCRYVDPKAP